jgi:steroid delta-isomerase
MLERHVALFNEGVRTGNFEPMLEGFADDAALVFEGAPVGPFVGKRAIAAAYRSQPPDDEIEILGYGEEAGGAIVAGYAWRRAPSEQAGEMRITGSAGKIECLVVTFDRRP